MFFEVRIRVGARRVLFRAGGVFVLYFRVSYSDIFIVYYYKLNFLLFRDRYLVLFFRGAAVPYKVAFLTIVIALPSRSIVPGFFVPPLGFISVNYSYIYKAGVRSLRSIAVPSRFLFLSIVSSALTVIFTIIVAKLSSFVLARFSLSVNLSLVIEVPVIDSGYQFDYFL